MRGRFVAHDSAKSGRDAARSTGIGSERTEGHPVRHRNGGAGGGASGDPSRGAIPGIERSAVVRVESETGEGKLGQVGAADDDETGSLHPCYGGADELRRRRIAQHGGGRSGGVARDVEQVLHRDRNAGIGTRCRAMPPHLIVEFGGGQRLRGVHLQKGARTFALLVRNPLQTLCDQRTAARASGGQRLRQAGESRRGVAAHRTQRLRYTVFGSTQSISYSRLAASSEVLPVLSYGGATSTRSPPTICRLRQPRMISSACGTVRPAISGVPVPGAK